MEQLRVIEVDTLPLRGLSPYLWAVYNFFQRLSYGKGEWLLTDTPSVTQQVTIHRTDSRGRLDPGCIQPHSLCLCAFPSQANTLSNQKKTMRDILQNSWPAPLRVLCKHQDLSSGPRASVESQAMGAHVCYPSTVGGTGGSQQGSWFSKQSCLERVRQRVLEQSTQCPLWSP